MVQADQEEAATVHVEHEVIVPFFFSSVVDDGFGFRWIAAWEQAVAIYDAWRELIDFLGFESVKKNKAAVALRTEYLNNAAARTPLLLELAALYDGPARDIALLIQQLQRVGPIAIKAYEQLETVQSKLKNAANTQATSPYPAIVKVFEREAPFDVNGIDKRCIPTSAESPTKELERVDAALRDGDAWDSSEVILDSEMTIAKQKVGVRCTSATCLWHWQRSPLPFSWMSQSQEAIEKLEAAARENAKTGGAASTAGRPAPAPPRPIGSGVPAWVVPPAAAAPPQSALPVRMVLSVHISLFRTDGAYPHAGNRAHDDVREELLSRRVQLLQRAQNQASSVAR